MYSTNETLPPPSKGGPPGSGYPIFSYEPEPRENGGAGRKLTWENESPDEVLGN